MLAVADGLTLLVLAADHPDAIVMREARANPGERTQLIALHIKCALDVTYPLFHPSYSPDSRPSTVITCLLTNAEFKKSNVSHFQVCTVCGRDLRGGPRPRRG